LALRALELFPVSPLRTISAFRAVCLAHLGQYDEALAIRARFGDLGSEQDESGVHVLTCLLEAAILGSERETAAAITTRLAGLAASAYGRSNPVCVARLLGDAATLLDDRASARRYYDQALETAGKIRFRPEIALTHLGLAELLLKDTDEAQRTEALGHLDFAMAEFRDMRMQRSLERALRHKEVLKA